MAFIVARLATFWKIIYMSSSIRIGLTVTKMEFFVDHIQSPNRYQNESLCHIHLGVCNTGSWSYTYA